MINKFRFMSLLFLGLMLSSFSSQASMKIKFSPSLAILQEETADWKKLIQFIASHGKIMEADMYSYLYIENTQLGTNGKDRQSEYLSLVGYVDQQGIFNASHLEGVSENWMITSDQKNWNIDQWLFKIDGTGNLKWAAHMDMIQTVDHQVLKHEYVQESQDSLANQWKIKLQAWYQFINK